MSKTNDPTPSSHELETSAAQLDPLVWTKTPTGWSTDHRGHFDAEIYESPTSVAVVEIRCEQWTKDAKAFVQAVRDVVLRTAVIVPRPADE